MSSLSWNPNLACPLPVNLRLILLRPPRLVWGSSKELSTGNHCPFFPPFSFNSQARPCQWGKWNKIIWNSACERSLEFNNQALWRTLKGFVNNLCVNVHYWMPSWESVRQLQWLLSQRLVFGGPMQTLPQLCSASSSPCCSHSGLLAIPQAWHLPALGPHL